MEQIVTFIKSIIGNLVFKQKLNILLVLMLAAMFFIINFPAQDLSDIASSQLTRLTGTYMQFDSVSINLIPSPGVSAENVLIEASTLPPLKTNNLDLAVSVLSALTLRMGGSANLDGIFGGNVTIDFNEGDKLKSGERAKTIDAQAMRLNLQALTHYLQMGGISPLAMQGALSLSTNMNVDPLFNDQPKGTLGIDIASFTFPGQSVPTSLGPMPAPEVKFGKLSMKANIGDGNLDIQELNFGEKGSDLTGKIRGQLGMILQRSVQGVAPMLGRYDLNIDLTVSKAFIEANGSMLNILLDYIKDFRRETATGPQFKFRVQTDPNGQPKFSAP